LPATTNPQQPNDTEEAETNILSDTNANSLPPFPYVLHFCVLVILIRKNRIHPAREDQTRLQQMENELHQLRSEVAQLKRHTLEQVRI